MIIIKRRKDRVNVWANLTELQFKNFATIIHEVATGAFIALTTEQANLIKEFVTAINKVEEGKR